jgi:hypothetical protein
MRTEPVAIDLSDLPATIVRYLDAHRDNDPATAIGTFTGTAIVVDDGHTYTGTQQIRDWLSRSATEFTYTIKLTTAAQRSDRHYDTINHLEGNFPGSAIDLRYRFTLDHDDRITNLVIEPLGLQA